LKPWKLCVGAMGLLARRGEASRIAVPGPQQQTGSQNVADTVAGIIRQQQGRRGEFGGESRWCRGEENFG
jgi:hypothetical protein